MTLGNMYIELDGYFYLILASLLISIGVQIAIIVIAVKMAERRNRSKGLWGFLAFMFGWITILILACLSKLPDEDEEKSRYGQYGQYPYGQHPYYGQYTQQPYYPQQQSGQRRQQPPMRRCGYCGAVSSYQTCPYCGTRLY